MHKTVISMLLVVGLVAVDGTVASANVNAPHAVSFDHQKLLASIAAGSELRARAWVAQRLGRADGIGSADWLSLAGRFDQRAQLVRGGSADPSVSLGVSAQALARSAAAIRAAVGSLPRPKPSNAQKRSMYHTLVVHMAAASQAGYIADARKRLHQAVDALRRGGRLVRGYGLDAFRYGNVVVMSVNAVGDQNAQTLAIMIKQLAQRHGGRL